MIQLWQWRIFAIRSFGPLDAKGQPSFGTLRGVALRKTNEKSNSISIEIGTPRDVLGFFSVELNGWPPNPRHLRSADCLESNFHYYKGYLADGLYFRLVDGPTTRQYPYPYEGALTDPALKTSMRRRLEYLKYRCGLDVGF